MKIFDIIMMLTASFLVGFVFTMCTKQVFAAEPYKVAVIDTGFTPMPFEDTAFKLCKKGHYDFNDKHPTVGFDTVRHGSYVTLLIDRLARTDNMCFLIYKVFGPNTTHKDVASAMIKAYKNGARAINMSLSTNKMSHRLRRVTNYITKKGVRVFAAAGNESTNLNEYCNIYPQCLKNINSNLVIVGAVNAFGEREKYSNYGVKLDVYDWGTIGTARGTSFATPRALGSYINSLNLDKKGK